MATKDDEKKTKAQLLEEIEELRRQLTEHDQSGHDDAASSQPAFTRPITRRTAISKWVAPVILSIPLATVTRTRTAEAGTSFPTLPTLPPTMLPTLRPTLTPTLAPTLAPTAFPTLAPAEAPALGSGGLAAAAVALAGIGAARLRQRGQGGPKAESEQQPDRAADDSQDKDETK
jgi:hypothetical protein